MHNSTTAVEGAVDAAPVNPNPTLLDVLDMVDRRAFIRGRDGDFVWNVVGRELTDVWSDAIEEAVNQGLVDPTRSGMLVLTATGERYLAGANMITIGGVVYPVPADFDLRELVAAIETGEKKQFRLTLPPSPSPRKGDRRLIFGAADVEAIKAHGLDRVVAA